MNPMYSTIKISCHHPIYDPKESNAVSLFFQGYFSYTGKQYRIWQVDESSKRTLVSEEHLPWSPQRVLLTIVKIVSIITGVMPLIGLYYLLSDINTRAQHNFMIQSNGLQAPIKTPVEEEPLVPEEPLASNKERYFENIVEELIAPSGASQAIIKMLTEKLFIDLEDLQTSSERLAFIEDMIKNKSLMVEGCMKKIDNSQRFLDAKRSIFEKSFDDNFNAYVETYVDNLIVALKDPETFESSLHTISQLSTKVKNAQWLDGVILSKVTAFINTSHDLIIDQRSCIHFFHLLNQLANQGIFNGTVKEYLKIQYALMHTDSSVHSSPKASVPTRVEGIKERIHALLVPSESNVVQPQHILRDLIAEIEQLEHIKETYFPHALKLLYAKSLMDGFCEENSSIVNENDLAALIQQLSPLLSANPALEDGFYYKELQESYEMIATRANDRTVLDLLALVRVAKLYNPIALRLGLDEMVINNCTDNDELAAQLLQEEEIVNGYRTH